jgi:KDO2-lipid IV(A) lauroyltransferase
MGRVIYTFLYIISLQPFWLLYIWSDLIFFLLYKVFRYRVELVKSQLAISYPDKTQEEIETITNQYYKNLADYIVETIKLVSISQEELDRRMPANWEEINKWHQQGRIVQGHLAHQFNWEWGTVLCNWKTPYQFVAIYNPVSSPSMEWVMQKIRGKSGTKLVNMLELNKVMVSLQNDPSTLWGFIADQNPIQARRGYWTNFLNRDTVFNKGAEMIARRYDNVIIFGNIIRVKRGYYRIELETVFEHGAQTSEGEITEAYARYLEKKIHQKVDNWVWSHRRWKHIREAKS